MEKNIKFKYEETFYKKLTEKSNEMYSIIDLDNTTLITPSLLFKYNTKYKPYFLYGKMYENMQIYSDVIFYFDDDIYIYLSNTDINISSFYCKIYYPISKKQDIDFFILNLKKIK
jgi:hypothetical protein